MPGRIVVIGGLNMDLHLFGLQASLGQAPMVADHYLAMPGGKGGNVARAAARLGADVSLIGRVGDDEFGRDCVDAVAADGVDTRLVVTTDGSPTGFVAIELREGRHRSLVFAPGANDHLSWQDVEPGLDGLGPDDLLIVQAEVPPAVLDRLSERSNVAPMFLDPTPPERVGRRHLTAAEVITPDAAEAAELVGRALGSRLWPALAARELLESGARRAVLKLGPPGAILADDEGVFEIPTVDVDPVDETGAGDVFLAALAVKRLEGADWREATMFANVASALSVASAGLMLPDRESVDQRHQAMDETPVRIGPSRL